MVETLTVRCPNCGNRLSVRNMPNIENHFLTCPVCKRRMLFKEYDLIEETETVVEKGYSKRGVLVNISTGERFPLRNGRNIVGRKAQDSAADIQIECPTKRLSREHLVIQVTADDGSGYKHCASLYKEKENATFVDNLELIYSDKVILRDHDIIKLPDVSVRFEIPQ